MKPTIRLATENDADAVLAIYAPYCLSSAISFELEPPGLEEMRRRIRATMPRLPWLVAEAGQHVVGYAYASPHRERAAYRWSVDSTVYVAQRQQRSGIGRALYTSLFQILRLQGFFNAFAGIALPNPGSVGLHEAMGFQPVGIYRHVGYKVGAWHDVSWWHLPLQPPVAEPPLPRDLGQIAFRCSEWQQVIAKAAEGD